MAGMTEPTPGDWQAYSDPAKGCSFVVADMRDTVARCDRIADAVAMSATKELAGIAERWLRLFDRGGPDHGGALQAVRGVVVAYAAVVLETGYKECAWCHGAGGKEEVMTEAEWLASKDPQVMLTFLRKKHPTVVSDRKVRLFACACVRQVWRLLTDERSRRAVLVSESFADGKASARDLEAARGAAWGAAREAAWERQAHTLCDLVGNPFRPVSLCGAGGIERTEPTPDCAACRRILTPTVLAMAEAAYDARDDSTGNLDPFRLALLSDELELAGCTSAAVLSHLRSAGPHCRGMWSLDLILSME